MNNDPNVSPAFAAAIRPTPSPWHRINSVEAGDKPGVATWRCVRFRTAPEEAAALKRDKEDQDHRERVLGDAMEHRE
ncbi:MAG: hypothetical protein ABMA00_13650 [Gemmatimonas sp.]